MNGWGDLQWSEAEFLEEMAFLHWCHDSVWPESIALWLLHIAETTEK